MTEPDGQPAELALTTPRLVLEPCAESHADDLFPAMHAPKTSQFLAWAPHRDVGETRMVLQSLRAAHLAERGYHWTLLEGGRGLGIVSLIDVRRSHRLWLLQCAEIAYWIAPDRQGRGLATEAVAAVVAAAFTTLAFNRLLIMHTSANAASGRIPQKLGFRHVGVESQAFQKGGVWYDMNRFELLRQDWLTRQPAVTTP